MADTQEDKLYKRLARQVTAAYGSARQVFGLGVNVETQL